jgi:hypothetical protein
MFGASQHQDFSPDMSRFATDRRPKTEDRRFLFQLSLIESDEAPF